LAEVIARINDLFGGELGPEEIEGFVKPVAAKAEKAPGIAPDPRGLASAPANATTDDFVPTS
jgi:hypothetical protein